jgi:NAD(P)-dependent dehydrogenase (short-subunit alcohol dehydrogenase family)
VIVGKLDGKVAVITGGSSGMALAGAKLFVDEGAHVFISGRPQEALEYLARFAACPRSHIGFKRLMLTATPTGRRKVSAPPVTCAEIFRNVFTH